MSLASTVHRFVSPAFLLAYFMDIRERAKQISREPCHGTCG
ncbi:hypothetical protein [Sphingopyxis sp. RIFCSPHIGHO2_12_FULL_65_19]|nr:hypothetical protein [Sphingopyxis sp. RIFCSPHIGHO2_12_FULL_65_19]